MTDQRLVRILVGMFLFGVVAVVVMCNGINLIEAYGSGAPYYSRTTNMDKWSDPVPGLLATDSVTVVLVAGYVLWGKRKT